MKSKSAKKQYDSGLFGWIIQEIGALLLSIITVTVCIFMSYFIYRLNILIDISIILTVVLIILICGSIAGIGSIIIRISNIIYLIKEFRKDIGKY